tara:strand:- start:33457 stop:33945 length:489 start_codon:yes stop_codon:yes gene_type:complete
MPKIHNGEKYFTISEVVKTLKTPRKKIDKLLAKGVLEITQLPRYTQMMVTAKSVAKAYDIICAEGKTKDKKPINKKDDGQINKKHWGRILHLTYVQMSTWEKWLCDEPFIKSDKKLQKSADKICADMNLLYQDISSHINQFIMNEEAEKTSDLSKKQNLAIK